MGSWPRRSMLAFAAGDSRALAAISRNWLTVVGGVFAETYTPNQGWIVKPGTPISLALGTSGSAGFRLSPDAANALTLPDCSSGATDTWSMKNKSTTPLATSVRPGADAL